MTLTEFLKLNGWLDTVYLALYRAEKIRCCDAILEYVGLTNHPKAIYAWQLALSYMSLGDTVASLTVSMEKIAYLMLDNPKQV